MSSRIVRLLGRTEGEIDQILTALAANATWRRPAAAAAAPDTGDDHLWAFLASRLDSPLVTGDRAMRWR